MKVPKLRGGACSVKIIEKVVPQGAGPDVDKFSGVGVDRNGWKCMGKACWKILKCDVGHTQLRRWFAYSGVLVSAERVSSAILHSNSQPSPLSSHSVGSLASARDGLTQAVGTVVGAGSGQRDVRRLGVGFPVGHPGTRKVGSRPIVCVDRPSPPGVPPFARRPSR